MCKIAENEWKSLFTIDVENIWRNSPKELRMILTIHYILQKELKHFEDNMNKTVDNLKQKLNLSQSLQNDDCTFANFDILSSENADSINTSIIRSPKIQRHRKRNYKYSLSPSLLDVPKENNSKVPCLIPPQPNLYFKEKEINEISPVTEVVDSSIVIDDISEDNTFKKTRFIKKSNMKKTKSKNSSLTLTQLFTNISSQSDNLNNVATNNKQKETENLPRRNLFKDYDKIVIPKCTMPEYPHKTEPIRKKADRMQLPGWSCTECQKYYEGLNLPLDKLKEKMNQCSKHRNRYEPLNDTPKGFWDVTIFSSQDN